MKKLKQEDLAQLDRERFDALRKSDLIDLTERLRDLCIDLYEKLNRNSSNSSKPPSSDDPFSEGKKQQSEDAGDDKCDQYPDEPNDGNSDEDAATAKNEEDETEKRKPGKQIGAPGFGRIENTKPEITEDHFPEKCVICSSKLGKPPYPAAYAGHRTYELVKGDREIRIVCTLHRYHSIVCCSCGHENKATPGEGFISVEEGRKRDLRLSENRLVGPMLATFIASLNREFRMSRKKIRQYLIDWFGFRISEGTICNCIREAGVACYPVVDELVGQLQEKDKAHLDETPWYQKGIFLWLWVAVADNIVVYFIGSRKKEELLKIITEAFLGWLITDGYGAYRHYPKRQRCLAHLIRKAVALTGAVDQKARKTGDWFLRELRGMIKAVARGEDGTKQCGPILARLKRACNLGAKSDHAKLKALAGEILNDWDAVVAFVKNPGLPATNNEAERALRMAVIFRKICYGSRTDEGSRSFASFISVTETCKRRGVNPWEYIACVIACGRKGIAPPPVPIA